MATSDVIERGAYIGHATTLVVSYNKRALASRRRQPERRLPAEPVSKQKDAKGKYTNLCYYRQF